MTWRIDPRPAGPNGPMIPILQMIILQDAWRALTPKSRSALLAIAENPLAVVHPASVKALRSHGLLNDFRVITEAGAAVVRHRTWMSNKEARKAIPPAYTRWIGEQFLTLERSACPTSP